MASSIVGIVDSQRGESSRHGGSSLAAPTGGSRQDWGWIPVALGTAALLARIGGQKKGTKALALTALAGVAAVEAMRGLERDRDKAAGSGQDAALDDELEVERSITIGKSAEELRRCWLDPRTLPRVMSGFATVRAIDKHRMHWKVEAPLGRTHEWDTDAVDVQPGEGIGWRSVPNATVSTEGAVRFRPAPGGRGTVATLRLRFDPPRGVLGNAVFKLLGHTPVAVLADQALRRFKSLTETGEIPTTDRQPAARADTR